MPAPRDRRRGVAFGRRSGSGNRTICARRRHACLKSANCVGCHKWSGNGGGSYGGDAANLGNPAEPQRDEEDSMPSMAGMPHFQPDAYADGKCYGLKESDLPQDKMPPGTSHPLRPADMKGGGRICDDPDQRKRRSNLCPMPKVLWQRNARLRYLCEARREPACVRAPTRRRLHWLRICRSRRHPTQTHRMVLGNDAMSFVSYRCAAALLAPACAVAAPQTICATFKSGCPCRRSPKQWLRGFACQADRSEETSGLGCIWSVSARRRDGYRAISFRL